VSSSCLLSSILFISSSSAQPIAVDFSKAQPSVLPILTKQPEKV
jgi:hypothetical protein